MLLRCNDWLKWGHGTKSLRDSPLRGEPDREDVTLGKDHR
jgi:hypothetical protein